MKAAAQLDRLHEMEWFTKRVGERAYVLSEHVVRALMGGHVSVSDIEMTLQAGRLLEEHRHAMRGTSYLIAGRNGGKFVHLLCAACDGLAVILFAYRPSTPIWENPLRRTSIGNNNMSGTFSTCFFCGGELKKITVGNFDYRLEGKLYVIKSVPASLCQECGEKYIDPDVGHRMNALIAAQAFTASEQVGVIEYR
jgi:YgiT-type zinc finger domain-containing protein